MSGGDAPGREDPVFGYLEAIIALLEEPDPDKEHYDAALRAGRKAHVGDNEFISVELHGLRSRILSVWAKFLARLDRSRYSIEREKLIEFSPFAGDNLIIFLGKYGVIEVYGETLRRYLQFHGVKDLDFGDTAGAYILVAPASEGKVFEVTPPVKAVDRASEPEIPFK